MSSLPATMRAAQYTSASNGLDKSIYIAHIPTPSTALNPGQTLIKVSHASLNPADYKIAESIAHYTYTYKHPCTPGLDFSGTVVKSTRSDLSPGQKVFGNIGTKNFGALAEFVVVDDSDGAVVGLPQGVEMDQAACVGVTGLTAYQSLAPYAPLGKVFINGGSGGTGTFGIGIAKALGAHVGVSCSGGNVQLCKDLGADEVIDYKTQDLLSELGKHGNGSFDLFVDNVFNSTEVYWRAHEFIKPRGRYVCIAGTPSLGTLWNFIKVYTLPGFLGGGKRPFSFFVTNPNQKDLKAMGQWMAEGRVRTLIDQDFELEDVGKAYAKLKTGRTRGKIVIKIGDGA